MFVVQKDGGLIPRVLTQILDSCVNGVTLTDPDIDDNPIVYANKAFEDISGYTQDEIVGRNCRFLQGVDRNQPELERLREGLKKRQSTEVTLRNYRKDGTLFLNRLVVKPLFDSDGEVVYFLGVQYDVTNMYRANEGAVDLLNATTLPRPFPEFARSARSGRYIYCNDEFVRTFLVPFSMGRDNIIDMDHDTLWGSKIAPIFRKLDEIVVQRPDKRGALRGVTFPGEERVYDIFKWAIVDPQSGEIESFFTMIIPRDF
jgi:PAS domain S-box-containing protein